MLSGWRGTTSPLTTASLEMRRNAATRVLCDSTIFIKSDQLPMGEEPTWFGGSASRHPLVE